MGVAEDFNAVDTGHFDVGDDHVKQCAIDLPFCQFTASYCFDLVAIAAKGDVEKFADGTFVVTDEDITHASLLLRQRQRRPGPRPLR
jgi:hypothetical protein